MIRSLAVPFESTAELTPLIDSLGDARIVMLGEASHGTADFYAWRSEISMRLIAEKGFDFIVVEGDWPECQAINRYVQGEGYRLLPVFRQFKRWPGWMWANTEVLSLTQWLRRYNQARLEDKNIGFHGFDVYSLFESIEKVRGYARKISLTLAREIDDNYRCFDAFRGNDILYAQATLLRETGCAAAAYANWRKLLDLDDASLPGDGSLLFDARQNALIVKNAESYYDAMVRDSVASWNIRDRHMLETLDSLLNHYDPSLQGRSKAIVWAHNTHVGDYRATDMVRDGSINIGGLARDRYGEDQVKILGFGTYEGTVTAARAWDGQAETMDVPPAIKDSYEALFHSVGEDLTANQLYLIFDQASRTGPLAEWRGHRAIGVVYQPEHEARGNYVPTSLSNRYDAFIFIDDTRALAPLPFLAAPRGVPQTWPTGV